MNANNHSKDMQNETPNSFNFSGISSVMMMNGNVSTANEATNKTNEKLTRRIQLYASMS